MNNTTNPSTTIVHDIIYNNYMVQRNFDDMHDGYLNSEYLSKEEAEKLKNQKRKPRYLTGYRVVKRLAIVGVVPFNNKHAYIFNKPLPRSEEDDNVTITSREFEELMNCYVFTSLRISKRLLDNLISVYEKRGGIVFEKYHSFENLAIRPEREKRQKLFRNTIVYDSIFKHGFVEVGKNRWSNGLIKIQESETQRVSVEYPRCNSHMDVKTNLSNRIAMGSIFGRFYKHINQLDSNTFGVVCNTNDSRTYHFTYFEVTFKS